jgi:hypothetical protein
MPDSRSLFPRGIFGRHPGRVLDSRAFNPDQVKRAAFLDSLGPEGVPASKKPESRKPRRARRRRRGPIGD